MLPFRKNLGPLFTPSYICRNDKAVWLQAPCGFPLGWHSTQWALGTANTHHPRSNWVRRFISFITRVRWSSQAHFLSKTYTLVVCLKNENTENPTLAHMHDILVLLLTITTVLEHLCKHKYAVGDRTKATCPQTLLGRNAERRLSASSYRLAVSPLYGCASCVWVVYKQRVPFNTCVTSRTL